MAKVIRRLEPGDVLRAAEILRRQRLNPTQTSARSRAKCSHLDSIQNDSGLPQGLPGYSAAVWGCSTGYFRGRSHHERARCRRGAELGFRHHRGPQRCRALFGSDFSCNLPVPIRSGLKPATDYGWEGYAPHATARVHLASAVRRQCGRSRRGRRRPNGYGASGCSWMSLRSSGLR